jgi:hypothetical protein
MDQRLIWLTVEEDFLRDDAILTDREALTQNSKDRPDREVFGCCCHRRTGLDFGIERICPAGIR